MRRTERSGFTLVELLLVVAVVVIIAAISLPKVMGVSREAKEAKLREALRAMRVAINGFVADCGGYPDKLSDVLREKAPRYYRDMVDGSRLELDPSDYRGPYLMTPDGGLPYDHIAAGNGWWYDPTTGRVASHANGNALDGTRYRDW